MKVCTIKNISLDLGLCVAEFIEGITCLISKSTVLYRSHNIHKNIILKKENKDTISVTQMGINQDPNIFHKKVILQATTELAHTVSIM